MDKDYYERQLSSSDIDDVYDALIDIGKKDFREYESKVRSFLHHKKTDIRRAAIMVLGCYWNIASFVDELYTIWKEDKDDDVRVSALICWVGYFLKSKNKNIIHELRALSADSQEDIFVRLEALRGIVNVIGATEDDINLRELERLTGYKEFEANIPWDKIDSLIRSHDIA